MQTHKKSQCTNSKFEKEKTSIKNAHETQEMANDGRKTSNERKKTHLFRFFVLTSSVTFIFHDESNVHTHTYKKCTS